MKHSQIIVGQDYEVGSETYSHLARVLEVGTFEKLVYGRREFRGHRVTVKGARVAYLDANGEPRLTKVQRDRVWGEKESTYIDQYDGATVVVPATEDSWVEKEVDATEWVESRQVIRTADNAAAIAKAQEERKQARLARDAERDEMHPHIERKLEDAGISKYNASRYVDGGEVKLSYHQLIALIASECAKFQASGS